MVNWLTDGWMDWLIDWLIDWMIDWLMWFPFRILQEDPHGPTVSLNGEVQTFCACVCVCVCHSVHKTPSNYLLVYMNYFFCQHAGRACYPTSNSTDWNGYLWTCWCQRLGDWGWGKCLSLTQSSLIVSAPIRVSGFRINCQTEGLVLCASNGGWYFGARYELWARRPLWSPISIKF